MWHYTEGIHNWDPIWPDHAIRIIPGPSSLWFDATGKRLRGAELPRLRHPRDAEARSSPTGYDYSWFVLTQTIIEKEFALSGSEQNPDITGKDLKFLVKSRLAKGAPGPVEAFKEHGEDFVVADTLADLVDGMNESVPRPASSTWREIERQIVARDRELDNALLQGPAADGDRQRPPLADRPAGPRGQAAPDPRPGARPADRRTAQHPDPQDARRAARPNLDSQVMRPDGTPFPGLYAAGEVAGFGGGGVHGYNALEGTFLGGCIFSGRAAGRALARARA